MRSWSLKKRITSRLVALVSAIWLMTSLATAYVFYVEIWEVLDSSLEETAHRIVPLVTLLESGRDGQQTINAKQLEAEAYEHEETNAEYVSYQLRDRSGNTLLSSHHGPETEWPLVAESGFSSHEGWRIYTVYMKDRDLLLQIGESIEHRWDAIEEMMSFALIPLIIVLPIIFLLTQRVLNMALSPVIGFSREIERRDPNNLADIQTDLLPNEFQAVASKLNDLLARVRKALEAERNFSSHSAHQFRTPIAAALAQSEMLERELTDGENKERVRKLKEALRRLGRIAEKLLQLARSDSSLVEKGRMVQLGDLIDLILNDFSRLYPERQFEIIKNEAVQKLNVDADAFGIILQNLIENAVSYATPQTPITIAMSGSNRLSIKNDCDPLSHDLLQHLGERFVRGATDTRGSGLGLAIVRGLTRLYEFNFVIYSPIRGEQSGFEIEIVFSN